MSVSIYYTARRAGPMTPSEQATVASLVDRASVDADLGVYLQTGQGLNWESFGVYDPAEPSEAGVIFEGSTKLPDNAKDALWRGVRHWAALLARIRQVLPDAAWHVHVDDHDLAWNERSGEYELGDTLQ